MTSSQPLRGLKRLVLSAVAVLSATAVNALLASPASAELDDTTISVAVAQGNAHCLIETKTMSVDEARDAVLSEPEFSDLMGTYIADQGGCKALVKQLQR